MSNEVESFAKITENMLKTYEAKNADYGNSFNETCDKFGLIAAIVRMHDKLNRITQLAKKEHSKKVDESIQDTLLDLANYAIMSLLWIETQNKNILNDLLNSEFKPIGEKQPINLDNNGQA